MPDLILPWLPNDQSYVANPESPIPVVQVADHFPAFGQVVNQY